METLEEIKQEIEEAKTAEKEVAPVEVPASSAAPIVTEELAKARQEVARGEGFQKASHEVATRDMRATLNAEALAVLSAEQKNALAEYTLKKEKERLDYRIKYEKQIDREEIRAEVYARKVANAEAMYGRYYKQEVVDTLDKDGNVVKVVRYKNFTTSKFVNKVRVFANWYNNLAEGSRKIIWTTIKIVLICGLIVGIGFGLFGLIKWLANSGILGRISEGAQQAATFIAK